MKRVITLALAAMITVTVTACSGTADSPATQVSPPQNTLAPAETPESLPPALSENSEAASPTAAFDTMNNIVLREANENQDVLDSASVDFVDYVVVNNRYEIRLHLNDSGKELLRADKGDVKHFGLVSVYFDGETIVNQLSVTDVNDVTLSFATLSNADENSIKNTVQGMLRLLGIKSVIGEPIYGIGAVTSRQMAGNAIISSNPYLTNGYADSRIWVSYGANKTSALINEFGVVIWETDRKIKFASQFYDGASYFCYDNNGNLEYNIIDVDGNITYSNSDSDFRILGGGAGQFFVVKLVATFDKYEWTFGTIDQNGKEVSPISVYEKATPDVATRYDDISDFTSALYLGDGIFNVGYADTGETGSGNMQILMNTRTQKMLPGSAMGVFENEQTIAEFKNYLYYDKLSVDGNRERVFSFVNGTPFATEYSEGLIFYQYDAIRRSEQDNPGAYFDIDGNSVIEFPEYADHEYRGGAFCNGYAVIRIKGADGKIYVTAINRAGERMFEPIKVDNALLCLYETYIVAQRDGGTVVLDLAGNEVISTKTTMIPIGVGNDILAYPQNGETYLLVNLVTGYSIGAAR